MPTHKDGEHATERIPVTPTTKELVKEIKDSGTTFDKWVRDDPRMPGGGQ